MATPPSNHLAWRVERLEEDRADRKAEISEVKADVRRAKEAAYASKDACELVASDQRVLVERMANMIDAYKAQRSALYTAAGALTLLAIGIILRALGVVG